MTCSLMLYDLLLSENRVSFYFIQIQDPSFSNFLALFCFAAVYYSDRMINFTIVSSGSELSHPSFLSSNHFAKKIIPCEFFFRSGITPTPAPPPQCGSRSRSGKKFDSQPNEIDEPSLINVQNNKKVFGTRQANFPV